jgi:uncharacterized protein
VKVQLDKSFPLPAAADAAWEFLQQLEAVAQCMPGAAITERIDEQRFKGTVSVRVGPASLSFRGEVEVKEIDPTTRTLRLLAKGTDTTGGSGASMDLTARIDPAGDASSLVGSSEVSMSGKAAAFGGRMLGAVADQVLKQFADNFAAQVATRAGQPATGASDAAGEPPPAAEAAGAAPSGAPSNRTGELNGLALMWAVLKNWLRGLFGKISGKNTA